MSAKFDTLEDILKSRYSCRGYLEKSVPREVIEQILNAAQRVPSWCNSQPWETAILSGAARDRLQARLGDALVNGPRGEDVTFPEKYEGVYKHRRSVCGWQLYEAVGVEKGDREGSRAQMMRNYAFFGAPHVAIISTPKALGPYGALDCGAYVTAFTLAAEALGIATIPQAAIAEFSQIVREEIDLDETRDVLCVISFGYADPDHPANQFRTRRAGLDEVVDWRD